MPSTLTEKSTRFMPRKPTTAQATSAMAHHGMAVPKEALAKDAAANPNIP